MSTFFPVRHNSEDSIYCSRPVFVVLFLLLALIGSPISEPLVLRSNTVYTSIPNDYIILLLLGWLRHLLYAGFLCRNLTLRIRLR